MVLALGLVGAGVVSGCGGGGTTTVTVTEAASDQSAPETSGEPSTAEPEEEAAESEEGDGEDEVSEREAAVLEASEEFLEAGVERDGDAVCELSTTEAIMGMMMISGNAGRSCPDAMNDLLGKLSESDIRHNEESLEALPQAKVEIVGDKATVKLVDGELEFVEADGHWLLEGSSER